MPVRPFDTITLSAGQTLDLSGTGRTVTALQPISVMPTYKARRRSAADASAAHKTTVGTWVNDDTNPATLSGYAVADCDFVRCVSGSIECTIENV